MQASRGNMIDGRSSNSLQVMSSRASLARHAIAAAIRLLQEGSLSPCRSLGAAARAGTLLMNDFESRSFRGLGKAEAHAAAQKIDSAMRPSFRSKSCLR